MPALWESQADAIDATAGWIPACARRTRPAA
jgi:hypothetical protein